MDLINKRNNENYPMQSSLKDAKRKENAIRFKNKNQIVLGKKGQLKETFANRKKTKET